MTWAIYSIYRFLSSVNILKESFLFLQHTLHISANIACSSRLPETVPLSIIYIYIYIYIYILRGKIDT